MSLIRAVYFAGAVATSVLLTACGGGGGGSTATDTSGSANTGTTTPTTPTTPATPGTSVGSGSATVTGVTTNKLQWQVPHTLVVGLKDSAGAAVTGALSCVAADPVALTVAADCSSATAHRVGALSVTVSGAGSAGAAAVTANLQFTGIPQRQPLADANTSGLVGGGAAFSAIQGNGSPWYWGTNAFGEVDQLMSTTALANAGLPVLGKQAAGVNFSDIVSNAIGSEASLALSESGELWSWGSNGHGDLGRDFINTDRTPGKVRNAANSGSLTHIVQAGMGDWNAAALADDGTVYTWGWGATVGQGANATGTYPNVVRLPSGAVLSNVTQISVSRSLTLALTSAGTVYGWGKDMSGNTGTGLANVGTVVYYAMPVLDANTQAPITGIVSVSAGYSNGAAVTSGGNVYVWGAGGSGQLGQGVVDYATNHLANLVKAPAGASGNLSGIKAVRIGGASDNGSYIFALNASGQIYAWGNANNGTLGQGNAVNLGNQSTLPVPVADTSGVGALSGVKAIGATSHGGYALLSTGEVVAWGSNYDNELGQQQSFTARSNSAIPLKVKDAAGTSTFNIGSLAEFKNLNRVGM